MDHHSLDAGIHVALTVGPDIDYIKARMLEGEEGGKRILRVKSFSRQGAGSRKV